MKKIIALLLVVSLAALSGCSSIELTGDQISTMQANTATAQMECYEWLEARALADAEAIENLTKEQAFLYLVMKSNNDMVTSLVGNSTNPCGDGNGVYDMIARMHEADRQMVGDISSKALGAVGIVGGIWATGNALGTLADAVQGTTITVDGEGNTTSADRTSTTQVQTSGETTGDNNSNGASESSGDAAVDTTISDAIAQCSGEGSQGSMATCIEEVSGLDVEIEGGITYIDGTAYPSLSE